jgi:signal transduction histidine kinase
MLAAGARRTTALPPAPIDQDPEIDVITVIPAPSGCACEKYAAVDRRAVRVPRAALAVGGTISDQLASAVPDAQCHKEVGPLLADEAAWKRIAALVARGPATAEGVSVVAAEVGRVLGATGTVVVRLDADGMVTVVSWASGERAALTEGTRWQLDPQLAIAAALATGRPTRCDDYSHIPCAFAGALREIGIRCGVAIPITVGTRLWGVLALYSTRDRPFPAGTEQRLAQFAELVAIALGNAENAAQLAASRARVMAASDQARRRIERDLHDGAQQRLVTLRLELRLLQASVPPSLPELSTRLDELADQVSGLLEELRSIARGIHPAILSEAGLGAALRALSRRSLIPVQLDFRAETRLPAAIEVAAYFVVSEALTNVIKHADASKVTITVEECCHSLLLTVQDDGVGGADPTCGSGLVGIEDRVEASGGTSKIASPPGGGTRLEVSFPL